MSDLVFKLQPYQDKFVFSEARYPAFVGAVGTGKTLTGILRMMKLMEESPNNLGIIVRKDFTDLYDSTIKDFTRYTGITISSHKEVILPNKSTILFRHGTEVATLKNINAGAILIEQAEEFETDEVFTFLRDRLRRQEAKNRSMFVIANTAGHNWIWKRWKNNPQPEFELIEATTFDNAENLPDDFIEDLKTMEHDSPNHYRRYVLNDWEETDADDYLFTWLQVQAGIELEFDEEYPRVERILGVDIARFGDDETVFTIIEKRGLNHWEQVFTERQQGKDLMWTVGRIIDIRREFAVNIVAVDDDGLGGGVTDRLRELNVHLVAFRGNEKAKNEEMFKNNRAESLFTLRDMVLKGYLKLSNDHAQTDQLLTIRYKYTSKGQKQMISKDDMRKEGIKSPDIADALMIAASCAKKTMKKKVFEPERSM